MLFHIFSVVVSDHCLSNILGIFFVFVCLLSHLTPTCESFKILLYLFIVTSGLYLWGKNAKFKTQFDMQKNDYFCTNKGIPKEILFETWRVHFVLKKQQQLRTIHRWRTKEEHAGLKTYHQLMKISVMKSTSLRNKGTKS